MRELVPTIDLHRVIMSVSSFLIMLVIQPLLENVTSARRSICFMSRAVVMLLARDDSVVADEDDDDHHHPSSGHCEQCARHGTSLSDVAAVAASLGLVDDELTMTMMTEGETAAARCGGCAAMAVVEELTESKVAGEAELREAFYVFDRDEDGFVTPDELWNVMRRLAMPEGARREDCRRMIAAHDGDGDGRISFAEFRALMENAV